MYIRLATNLELSYSNGGGGGGACILHYDDVIFHKCQYSLNVEPSCAPVLYIR